MIIRIKYLLKKEIIKIELVIKNLFAAEVNTKNGRREDKILYLKKCFCHPFMLLKGIMKKELNIKYIEMVLTTRCTLNCVGCSALMNCYNKRNDIDVDTNINSLKRLLSACDSIHQLRLLGGEPLLYPKLFDLLEFLSKQTKIKRVTIVTNGTLLIKDIKIINILKNDKFDVYISNYGKYSTKKDELIEQLKQNNIEYMLVSEDKPWRDYGNLENRNRKEIELRKQFLNCRVDCTSILNGTMHHCPRSSHGTNLNKIPLRRQDYINLLDKSISNKQLRKELYKFFYKYIPYVEACNYCNSATKELKLIQAGQQYKKK